MIPIKSHPEGAILLIRAHPGARRNELRGEHDGRLKVSVTQVAEKGKANKALVTLLSRAVRVPKSQVELLKGLGSVEKQFLIRGLSEAELAKRIDSAMIEEK